jgi:hypothetical protein
MAQNLLGNFDVQVQQLLINSQNQSQAVSMSQALGTLQAGILKNPRIEQPMQHVLESRFMQSPKADASTKSDFLRFGL